MCNVKKSLRIPDGVIRIRISKKNRQHNGQKKKVQKDKQRSTNYTRTIIVTYSKNKLKP